MEGGVRAALHDTTSVGSAGQGSEYQKNKFQVVTIMNIATRGGISWNFTPLFYNSRLSRQIPTPLVYNRTSILGMSTRLQRSQDGQRGPKGRPQGAQGHSKGNRSSQKDAQKGGQGLPKEPKGTHSWPKGSQRNKCISKNSRSAAQADVMLLGGDWEDSGAASVRYIGGRPESSREILGLNLSGIYGDMGHCHFNPNSPFWNVRGGCMRKAWGPRSH